MAYSGSVTYKDLIDELVIAITNYCENVDKNVSLPDQLKPGSVALSRYLSRKSTNDMWAKAVVVDNDTEYNNLIRSVSSTTVRNQLNEFFSARNISSKSDEVITFKGLMNFYVNAASFVAARIILVGNSFYNPLENYTSINENDMCNAKWSIRLYKQANVTYYDYKDWDPSQNFSPISQKYTYQNVIDDIKSLTQSMINPRGVKYVKTNITFGCCSSSSSSSCSSCSSSSSLFIAYMEI